MKDLIVYEWKKMMGRKITLICLVLLAFLQIAMFQGNSIPSEYFYDEDQERYVYGREAFLGEADYVSNYAGPLTDEKVQAILEDYRSLMKTAKSEDPTLLSDTMDMILFLFGDGDGNWNQKTVADIFPGDNTPVLGYSYGYANTLSYMEYLFIIMGIFLIIILSPVFCEEYTLHTDALLLTSRKGRFHLAVSKITAGFLAVLSLGGLTLVIHTLLVYLTFEGVGGETSVQLNSRFLFGPDTMTYSLNFREAYILSCVLWMSALLLLAGVVVLFSAWAKSPFIGLVLGLTFYGGLPVLLQSAGGASMVMSFLPACAMNIASTLKIPPISIGGACLPFTFVIAAVSVVLAVVCSIGAVKIYSGHKVS